MAHKDSMQGLLRPQWQVSLPAPSTSACKPRRRPRLGPATSHLDTPSLSSSTVSSLASTANRSSAAISQAEEAGASSSTISRGADLNSPQEQSNEASTSGSGSMPRIKDGLPSALLRKLCATEVRCELVRDGYTCSHLARHEGLLPL